MRASSCIRKAQRGAAALLVTVMLALAMVLAVACSSRNLAAEQRASASQWQSTRAFEAAEAGIEWVAARLNDSAPIAADCLPSGDAAAPSFRASHLHNDATTGAWVAATWNDAGTAMPLQAACMRDASGWHCGCPTRGLPSLPRADGSATARFQVQITQGSRPDVIHAIVAGCTRADSQCVSTDESGHEATAQIEADFAFAPALRSVPAAALTARGDVRAGAAPIDAENTDASTAGLAMQVGGAIDASALRLAGPAGSSLAGALVAGDTQLAALDHDRFFARYFGMAPDDWATQPSVTTLACAANCADASRQAVARGITSIALPDGARLVGPLSLGTADAPIVLVARGRLEIEGVVALYGVVYADALEWNGAAAPAAFVHGAVIVGGDYTGNAAPALVREALLLRLLKQGSGTFVRVNGSWKDF